MYFKTIYDINNFPDTILKDEINNLIVDVYKRQVKDDR